MDTCDECGDTAGYLTATGARLCLDCLEATGYDGDVFLDNA